VPLAEKTQKRKCRQSSAVVFGEIELKARLMSLGLTFFARNTDW
jgi:hypothetical protein